MAKEDKKQKENTLGVTVKKSEDMPEWYSQVCLKSELADFAPVKGCMIIRPLGYAVWQSIQDFFNARLKEKKVKNAYFPLFIPESFFKKEAQHASGFKPEVAWIANKYEGERLAIRPTSETIMYDSYSKWIRSWRDLPLRINQWANVVRWETEATKLFLRSREFLWQEGHCVYATDEENEQETLMFLDEYQKLCKELLALPVIKGFKTEKEKFAGAVYTTTIESFMPDGKALQCGTSHNLGQNFARSFNIEFLDKDGSKKLPYQSSWGISTRLIGATVMMHGDDKGLVLPPKVAPNKAVIVPILFDDTKDKVLKKAEELKEQLKEYDVFVDDRDEYNAGRKFNEWELKGVPIRIELGPKDLEKKQVVMVRRDTGEKKFVPFKDIKTEFETQLEAMHNCMYDKAKRFMDDNIVETEEWDLFKKAIDDHKMVKTIWCGETECEELIKEKTQGASSRLIPLEKPKPKGKCVHCGKEAMHYVYFSRSY